MALFPFTISSNAPPAAPVGRTRARWQRTGIDTLCGYVTTYRLRFSFTGRKDKNDKTMSGMGNARRHAFPGITITGYLWRAFTFKDFLLHKKTARRRFDSCSDIFSGIGRQIVFPPQCIQYRLHHLQYHLARVRQNRGVQTYLPPALWEPVDYSLARRFCCDGEKN